MGFHTVPSKTLAHSLDEGEALKGPGADFSRDFNKMACATYDNY